MLTNKYLLSVLTLLISSMLSNTLADEPEATATLPLAEILRLHQAQATMKIKKSAPPPVSYTIEKALFKGRLLNDAIDIKTRFALSVLADEWVKIVLLKLDDKTQIVELPSVKDGFFKEQDNQLFFLTKLQGHYQFDLRFLKFSTKKDQIRSVNIEKPAVLSRMDLEMDSGLFALVSTQANGQGDKLTVYETNNQYTIQWKRISVEPLTQLKATAKQTTESIVKSAHVSVVATLAGENIIRILYKLQFAGRQTLEILIPKEHQTKQVFLNSTPMRFEHDSELLKIPVQPLRAGDEEAILELVLTRQHKGYLLSGELTFQFPKISWGINELFVSLNLPNVFNYHWIGGSLAPKDTQAVVHYTHQIPTPGKRIHLHQQLVHGFTDTLFSYTVDLAGLYYNGR